MGGAVGKFEVLVRYLTHAGQRHPTGTVVELNAEQAERLQRVGAVRPASSGKKPDPALAEPHDDFPVVGVKGDQPPLSAGA